MKTFPIMADWKPVSAHESVVDQPYSAIPWRLIAAHERQAVLNHDQSLEVLAQRGGLCRSEAVAVLEDRRWRSMPPAEAEVRLREIVAEWEANCLANRKPDGL